MCKKYWKTNADEDGISEWQKKKKKVKIVALQFVNLNTKTYTQISFMHKIVPKLQWHA